MIRWARVPELAARGALDVLDYKSATALTFAPGSAGPGCRRWERVQIPLRLLVLKSQAGDFFTCIIVIQPLQLT